MKVITDRFQNASRDFTYEIGQIAYWSILEPGLGVINCCLPVLQPVLGKLTGSCIWNTRKDSKQSADSGGSSFGRAKITDSEVPRFPGGRFKRVNDGGEYPLTTKTTASYQERSGSDDYPDSFNGRSVLVSHDFTISHEMKR
jgi:hypothetical protein